MKLDAYLKERGLSHKDFSQVLGCSQEAVRLWCNGERIPRAETIHDIEAATNSKVGWSDFEPSKVA